MSRPSPSRMMYSPTALTFTGPFAGGRHAVSPAPAGQSQAIRITRQSEQHGTERSAPQCDLFLKEELYGDARAIDSVLDGHADSSVSDLTGYYSLYFRNYGCSVRGVWHRRHVLRNQVSVMAQPQPKRRDNEAGGQLPSPEPNALTVGRPTAGGIFGRGPTPRCHVSSGSGARPSHMGDAAQPRVR